LSDARPRPLAATETRREDWWDEVYAVFIKDLRSELRTKAALAGMALFALTAMVLIGFLVKTEGVGLTYEVDNEALVNGSLSIFKSKQTDTRAQILAALYWTVIYFSAMAGIPRVFLKEEETRTVLALRMAARPSAVYTGKLLFNCVLLVGVTTLVIGPFVLFMQPRVASWPLLTADIYLGALGLAGAGTLLGAIAAKAQNRGFMMVVIGFGPLLPILVLAVNVMTAALQGGKGNFLIALVSYVIVLVMAGGFLFDKVLEA
jgi:heme exporter protein B